MYIRRILIGLPILSEYTIATVVVESLKGILVTKNSPSTSTTKTIQIWYFQTICRLLNIKMNEQFQLKKRFLRKGDSTTIATSIYCLAMSGNIIMDVWIDVK